MINLSYKRPGIDLVSVEAYQCLGCNHLVEDPDLINLACQEADKASVPHLLQQLSTYMSLVNVERILQLPFGSMTLWTKQIQPEELALLRMITLFPQLLQVAEGGFEP